MTLYHVEGSGHGDAILMAHSPRERVVIAVDVYAPGGAVQPYAVNFLRTSANATPCRPDRAAARTDRHLSGARTHGGNPFAVTDLP